MITRTELVDRLWGEDDTVVHEAVIHVTNAQAAAIVGTEWEVTDNPDAVYGWRPLTEDEMRAVVNYIS